MVQDNALVGFMFSVHIEPLCQGDGVLLLLPVTFDKLGKALPRAAVVQREASLALLLHAEARRLHLGEGEAEVLVQVVQLVDKVAHVSPQNLDQHIPAFISYCRWTFGGKWLNMTHNSNL